LLLTLSMAQFMVVLDFVAGRVRSGGHAGREHGGLLLGAPKASPVWGSNVWVDAA
jgi:hypothetical protein